LNLDAGWHRKAMNDSFGEVVNAHGRRATSAVLWNQVLATTFLMGERLEVAVHDLSRTSASEHRNDGGPLCGLLSARPSARGRPTA